MVGRHDQRFEQFSVEKTSKWMGILQAKTKKRDLMKSKHYGKMSKEQLSVSYRTRAKFTKQSQKPEDSKQATNSTSPYDSQVKGGILFYHFKYSPLKALKL